MYKLWRDIKVIVVMFFVMVSSSAVTLWIVRETNDFSAPSGSVSVPIKVVETGHTFGDLLDALEWKESRGDANAKGDWVRKVRLIDGEWVLDHINGVYRAIGSFQLWKIYVDDVNRILGTWESKVINVDGEDIYRFTYADRLDRKKSRVMTWIYLTHYGDRWFKGDQSMPYLEYVARIHNGGPQGYLKESTKVYWEEVKAIMDSL